MAAGITPHEEVDEVLITIASEQQPRQSTSVPPPTVEDDERLLMVSFEGSARVKMNIGA